MNMFYDRPRRSFLRILTSLLILSMFPSLTPRLAQAESQRARQPIAARLIVTAQYDEEENVSGSDDKSSSQLKILLSCTRGVQLSAIANPNGTVDILDLPGAPASAGGSINYTTEFETHGGNASLHATRSFVGTFAGDGAFAEAFWSDEGNGLDIRIKAHAQLKGHCSQESKDDSGHATRTDKCEENIAASGSTAIDDKAEANEDTDRTPDTKYKTKFDLSFDTVPPPTDDSVPPQPNPIIDFADTTWHGAQTRGDAKAGYKVEFDGTKQSGAGTPSGKKRLHVSAQIVPGAPSRSAVESPGKRPGDPESTAAQFVPAALPRRFNVLI